MGVANDWLTARGEQLAVILQEAFLRDEGKLASS